MLQSLNININNNESNDKANAEVKKALIKAQTKLRVQRTRQRKKQELNVLISRILDCLPSEYTAPSLDELRICEAASK